MQNQRGECCVDAFVVSRSESASRGVEKSVSNVDLDLVGTEDIPYLRYDRRFAARSCPCKRMHNLGICPGLAIVIRNGPSGWARVYV